MLLVVFNVFDAIFLGKDILAPAEHRPEETDLLVRRRLHRHDPANILHQQKYTKTTPFLRDRFGINSRS